jgi:SAM-dependent methyltransferase
VNVAFPPSQCAAEVDSACDLISLGRFTDRSGKIGVVGVMQCRRCHHAVSVPAITDVRFLYENRQSQDFQPDSKGLAHLIKDIAFKSQARKLLRQIEVFPTKLLDFGCGSGQFTRVVGELLSPTNVTGSDFFSDPPAELVGRPYVPISGLSALEESFDVVTAMHVLEHDDNVTNLLARISKLVIPGGRLVVEVPNVDCLWAKLFGRHWDAWYLPYHRTHFSRNSIIRLLESCGLEVISVHGATVPTMGRTIANMFRSRNNIFWLLCGIILHPVQWLGEKMTARPTSIRVIARKHG